MHRIFKNYNPYVVILLIVLTLVMKFYYLVHPQSVIVFEHQPIWTYLTEAFNWQGNYPLFFTFLALLNIFGQALFLNKIVIYAQLYPYKTYFPAFSYILLTSLFPDWNYLSVYVLSNWFVLGLFYNLIKLGEAEDGRKLIFNSALMVSMATLMVTSNMFLLLILIVGILMLRSFKLTDWLLLLVGVLTPFYFTIAGLFLLDQMSFVNNIFSLDLMELPSLASFSSRQIWTPIIAIAIFTLWGFMVLNRISTHMLVQVKKLWLLLITASIIAVFGGFFNVSDGFYAWISALLPLSIIFTTVWYSSYRKWILNLLFYLGIAFALYLQWI